MFQYKEFHEGLKILARSFKMIKEKKMELVMVNRKRAILEVITDVFVHMLKKGQPRYILSIVENGLPEDVKIISSRMVQRGGQG